MELLANGQGKLVPFGDSNEMANAIIEILQDDSLFYSLRRKAYDYGRSKTWPKIGQAYWKLFSSKRLPVRIEAKAAALARKSTFEIPEPSLEHLKKLTDDTGLYQHARFTAPNRNFGYCTDDNARAVITMTKYYNHYLEPDALKLFEIYLSFTMHSQNDDGSIRNFMNFDRTWMKNEPLNDALGRLLWAFGTVMAKPPSSSYLSIIKDCFDKSVKYVQKQYPRGMAYSILGMSDYLKQFPGASDIKRQLVIAADKLVELYKINSSPDWQWFEDTLTYDNAVLPHALFVTALIFEDEKYTEVAMKTCEFLLDNTFDGNHFSFVGCNGWYGRSGIKAQFDQQPIEAAATVMMLRAAHDVTQNPRFLTLQRKAFDWFLGENDLHIPVYNFRTKGCHDALMRGGVNTNQGAESIISFLLSLLAIVESYTTIDKTAENTDLSHAETVSHKIDTTEKTTKKPTPIKDVPVDIKSKKNKVEELT